MSGPITQDFKPVTLKRNLTKEEMLRKGMVPEKKPQQQMTSTGLSAKKIDNEEITIPYSTHSLGQQIQQGRVAKVDAKTGKSMTQSELDKLCGFSTGTVQRYENGTAIANTQQISLMASKLGVKLDRPKPKKIVE